MNLRFVLSSAGARAIVGLALLAAAPSPAAPLGLPPSPPTPAVIWSIGGSVGGIVGSRFKSTLMDQMAAQGWGDDDPAWSDYATSPSHSSDAIPSVRLWVARTLPRNLEVRLGWGNFDLGTVSGDQFGVGGIHVASRFHTFSALLLYQFYGGQFRVGAGPTIDRKWVETTTTNENREENKISKLSTSPGLSLLAQVTTRDRKWYFLAAEAEYHVSTNAPVAMSVLANDGSPHSFGVSRLPIDAVWVGLSMGLCFGHGVAR